MVNSTTSYVGGRTSPEGTTAAPSRLPLSRCTCQPAALVRPSASCGSGEINHLFVFPCTDRRLATIMPMNLAEVRLVRRLRATWPPWPPWAAFCISLPRYPPGPCGACQQVRDLPVDIFWNVLQLATFSSSC